MYDLIILGGGPGGYVAAILGLKKGLKVLLIEKDKVGGVCLNRGCIPTKTMIHYAKLLEKVNSSVKSGIFEGDLSVNYRLLYEKKNKVVNTLVESVVKIIKKLGGEIIYGEGKLISPNTVQVKGEIYKSKYVIIAVGSVPLVPESWKDVFTGEKALDWESLPKSVVVVGGGVIGVEMSYWLNALGVKVEIVEMMDSIIPNGDKNLIKILTRELKKRKIKLNMGQPVMDIKNDGENFVVVTDKKEIIGEKVIVALGRRASAEWGGDFIGRNSRGWVTVDEFWRTNVPDHFAIGDITGKGMLAHTAMFSAEQVIKLIVGDEAIPYDDTFVPKVVYTEPEFAWVGLTEEQIQRKNIEYGTGDFLVRGTGRALAEDALAGESLVYFEKGSGKILGVHFIGENGGEIIHAAVVAISNGLTVKDFEKVIAAHPTITEGLKESFSDTIGWAIHKL